MTDLCFTGGAEETGWTTVRVQVCVGHKASINTEAQFHSTGV